MRNMLDLICRTKVGGLIRDSATILRCVHCVSLAGWKQCKAGGTDCRMYILRELSQTCKKIPVMIHKLSSLLEQK